MGGDTLMVHIIYEGPRFGNEQKSPRGHLMPQTPEQFQKMGDMYEARMKEKDEEIAKLKQTVNTLRQKLGRGMAAI